MGNTWTVEVWVRSSFDDEYRNETYWQGENAAVAFWKFFRARETKSGCIRLVYRGSSR